MEPSFNDIRGIENETGKQVSNGEILGTGCIIADQNQN
jgi:hypothetical protein